MAFQRGSATNYRNLLDQLDKFLTNKHVHTAAINVGGTGYVVGDLLSIAGGTVEGSMVGKIEVTSVAAGVVDGIRIYDFGAYSADPGTLTANPVTGGTGTGATINITVVSTGWTQRIKNISTATSVIEVNGGTITTDGSGYAVNDIVTIIDTISSVSKATFKVTAVSGSGEVLAIAVQSGGDYNTVGTSTSNYATSGGTGSSLRIRPTYNPVRDEFLWEGSGTGGNEVFIGARSGYSPSPDQRLWELAGFTGWNGGSEWEAQPGISPGRNSLEPTVNNNGASIMLSENPMNFWVAATTRRVILVVSVTGNYQSAYLGLLDPFGTDSEIPYPLFICGMTDQFNEDIGNALLFSRGPADPTARNSTTTSGPGFFRTSAGAWGKVWNGRFDGTDINANDEQDRFIYPTAKPDLTGLADADNFLASSPAWDDIIPFDKDSTTTRLLPSPDSGGNLYWPIPCVLMRSAGATTHRALGEVNGLFWVSAESGLSTEDKITAGTRIFRVFQMGNNSLSYAHFCVEEA